ncbi:MAG: glycosyltransferase [Rhodospirillaceae bacterium]|nr:glycosyltransferase [Rhodospirillaceae bacterium]
MISPFSNRQVNGNGDYLLLLNPDTIVLDGAIDKLVAFAGEKPEAAIWGGRTLFGDSSLNPASCWSRQTIWSLFCQALGLTTLFRQTNFFNPEGIGGWNREGQCQVDIVSGCFLLIRRKFWERLGGFDQKFFMYGEEADLCLRAAKAGARPMVSSDATIIHYGGASERVRVDKLLRLFRAKALLVSIHFSKNTHGLGIFLLALFPLSRSLVHALLGACGRKKSKENARIWYQAWQRRSEWISHPQTDKNEI